MTRFTCPTLSGLQKAIVSLCALALLYASLHFTISNWKRPSTLLEFQVDPATFPSPKPPTLPLPTLDLQLPNDFQLPRPVYPDVVPNIVHYVYSLAGDAREIQYFQYLAVRSALLTLKPDLILFHHARGFPPHGPYWDLLAQHIVLSPIDPPADVFGRPLTHYAHKADVIRLQVLLQYGGIYLDIDTFALRSFRQVGLLRKSAVLAMEEHWHKWASFWEPGGLCNAVIVAEPESPFLRRWLATYSSFDDNDWARHSVQLPWDMALAYPQEVTVLDNRAMFYPLWVEEDLRLVHEPSSPGWFGRGWDMLRSGQLAYHAWESAAARYLENLTPVTVARGETSFNRMARTFMGPEDLHMAAIGQEHPNHEKAEAQ